MNGISSNMARIFRIFIQFEFVFVSFLNKGSIWLEITAHRFNSKSYDLNLFCSVYEFELDGL